MKRAKSRVRLISAISAVTVVIVVVVSITMFVAAVSNTPYNSDKGISSQHNQPSSLPDSANTGDTGAEITEALLASMRWKDMGKIVADTTANPEEIDRIIKLIGNNSTPIAQYLKALLLLAQKHPKQALAVFDQIDIESIPADFLYAPHRLYSVINGNQGDPYLNLLDKAVRENKTSSLIRARVLAANGELEAALSSYLQSDPASWASYDLRLFSRIGSYQGLSVDMAKMIMGAISSGRVNPDLLPQLKQIARRPVNETEIAKFEARIKHAIKNKTPEGKIALESAKSMLRDRKIFLSRQYQELIQLYRAAEPLNLATETVLLLFLSSVEIEDQEQAEAWGQELKRRHGEPEVREWVNKTIGTA